LNKFCAFAASVAVIFSVSLQPVHAAITQAYASGNDSFYSVDPATGALTSVISGPNFYDLGFAPDGTLYGLSRGTDSLYRIESSGAATKLTALGTNSGGGAFTVSPDGQYIYYTAFDGIYTPKKMYRYGIQTNVIDDLGIINDTALRYAKDFEFGADGTLYAVSNDGAGYIGETDCYENLDALYTVDLNSLATTRVSDYGMGLDVGCLSYINNLQFDPEGFMHMTVNSRGAFEQYNGAAHFMGVIDIDAGQATMSDRMFSINGNGQPINSGLDVAYFTTAVPVPAAVWLFGSALAGLGWLRRRK
jgi:hypothetical protein